MCRRVVADRARADTLLEEASGYMQRSSRAVILSSCRASELMSSGVMTHSRRLMEQHAEWMRTGVTGRGSGW